MAKGGIVERLFGGEGEGGDEGEHEALGQPVADAVAMDLAGGSAEARAYLNDARRLIAIQTDLDLELMRQALRECAGERFPYRLL